MSAESRTGICAKDIHILGRLVENSGGGNRISRKWSILIHLLGLTVIEFFRSHA